jgi:DNA polymerase
LSPEEKRLALHTLDATQVKGCTKCAELARTRKQTVFGVGDPNAELMFIGEAPGADEDRKGEPFVGAAGQLLDKIIAACGMKREEVFIGNVLKCRPPGNRTPNPDEVANCRGYLEEQIRIIGPKFICCWGAVAAQTLLNSTLSISKLRKKFHTYQGIPVLCTYHPSYLLRNPSAKKDVWEDMKMLLAKMGRPVPQGNK